MTTSISSEAQKNHGIYKVQMFSIHNKEKKEGGIRKTQRKSRNLKKKVIANQTKNVT